MSAKPPEEEHDDECHYPSITFVNVHQVIADEARYQTAEGYNDDAHHEGQSPWVDGCKRLATQDNRSHGKPEPEPIRIVAIVTV